MLHHGFRLVPYDDVSPEAIAAIGRAMTARAGHWNGDPRIDRSSGASLVSSPDFVPDDRSLPCLSFGDPTRDAPALIDPRNHRKLPFDPSMDPAAVATACLTAPVSPRSCLQELRLIMTAYAATSDPWPWMNAVCVAAPSPWSGASVHQCANLIGGILHPLDPDPEVGEMLPRLVSVSHARQAPDGRQTLVLMAHAFRIVRTALPDAVTAIRTISAFAPWDDVA